MSQSSTSASRAQVFEDDGTPLQATFSFELRDGKTTLLFFSRGGTIGGPNERNRDYIIALEVLLARLGAGGARLDEVRLETLREQRVLNVHPVDLRTADAHEVKTRICREQISNRTRQIRLFFSGLNVVPERIEEFLSKGRAGAFEPGAPDWHEPAVLLSRTEGRARVRLSSTAERDPSLRADAIRVHGARCMACGFSFSETYGEWGADFIEVHHLQPISDGERVTNPAKDLVPLCANCHRMVHRKRGITLTLDELRAKLLTRPV
ncbi:HNH endonuclease [Melittangium boletus]|uniref:HNH endonuclease n=1 Tax=Melittangium boletus TaxID=83453 RepID=UPI003DA3FA52